MGSIVKSVFGGGSSAPAPSGGGGSGSQFTQSVIREAPGIEERKIELMDLARAAADQPVNIPAMQVAQFSPLEQQGLTAAGTTGVGQPTVSAGIGQLLAAGTPNINQFFNPYQSFVVDEINRQAAQAQNRLGAQAVMSGAFGGGREGIAQAELERRRLGLVGEAQAQGFTQAQQAAQTQRAFQTEAQMQAGSNLMGAGQQQQAMAQQDISQLSQAGGLQRGLAQEGLAATRATELERAYEPFQRLEFAKGIMTALPTTASQITQAAAPRANPFAQSVGAGITAGKGVQMFGQKLTG